MHLNGSSVDICKIPCFDWLFLDWSISLNRSRTNSSWHSRKKYIKLFRKGQFISGKRDSQLLENLSTITLNVFFWTICKILGIATGPKHYIATSLVIRNIVSQLSNFYYSGPKYIFDVFFNWFVLLFWYHLSFVFFFFDWYHVLAFYCFLFYNIKCDAVIWIFSSGELLTICISNWKFMLVSLFYISNLKL